MKVIILFFFMFLSINLCYCQYRDTNNIDYKKIYLIIDEIINKADNINSLIMFLKDSNNTVSNTLIRYFDRDSNYVIDAAKELSEHIIKNKFKSDYIIETKDLYKPVHVGVKFLAIHIKIRCKFNKEIIVFIFDNFENGIWKLSEYDFCTNFMEQFPSFDKPCKKD